MELTESRHEKFPTNFHTKYRENSIRKAFAGRQKRVKYAAADQGSRGRSNVSHRHRTRGKPSNGIQRNEISAVERTYDHPRCCGTQDDDSHFVESVGRSARRPRDDHGHGPGTERAHVVRSQNQKRGRGNDPCQKTSRVGTFTARGRDQIQASGKSLGREWQRKEEIQTGGHGEREFSGASHYAACTGKNSGGRAGRAYF